MYLDGTENEVVLTVSEVIWPALVKWFSDNKIENYVVCPTCGDGGSRIGFTGVSTCFIGGGNMLQLTAPAPKGDIEQTSKTWFMINDRHYAGYSETKP